jgi:hypothetical protein
VQDCLGLHKLDDILLGLMGNKPIVGRRGFRVSDLSKEEPL